MVNKPRTKHPTFDDFLYHGNRQSHFDPMYLNNGSNLLYFYLLLTIDRYAHLGVLVEFICVLTNLAINV